MPGDLQYITIDDFRPGIQHRTFGGGDSTKTPPGAADPANTFRCRAFPWGGLGPLPDLVQTKSRILPNDGDVIGSRCRIIGLHVTGPIQEETWTSITDGQDAVELHIVYQYFNGALDNEYFFWERYQLWKAAETPNDVAWHNISHPGSFAQTYRPASLVDARLHATDATALGDLYVCCGWHPDDMDSPENQWILYPDPADPDADGTGTILDVNETTILVQHQGRIISVDNHVFDHGAAGHWVVNDQLVWTQVNLPTVEMDGSTVLGVGVFTQGPVSGYGAAASASAQELLLVKHRGGATTISGDIDDPTVFSLPGVTSTQGALTFGTYTPKGFVYGVKNGGVHAWGGGDTSEKLSPLLDDNFWHMRPSDWADFDGKFDLANDLLLTPNNWIYDFQTSSWWRIEDPELYQIFQWSASPRSSAFYGVPVDFGEGEVIWYKFDSAVPVTNYVWQSQYFAVSIDRVLDIRELMVRALAPNDATISTLIITLSNEDGDVKQEAIQVESSTIPKLQRVDTKFQGTGIKVKVEASTSDGGPAPIIYELSIGYQIAQRQGAN